MGRDSSFPAASHNVAPPPCPPAFTVGLAPLSPQPRAPAWLTPCNRPTLGCTTTQVSLGATRPGGFEGPQKGIGRFGGARVFRLSSEESTLPSPHPWAQNDLRGEGYLDWAELVKAGQADGAVLGGWLLGGHCPLPPLSPAAYPSAYAPVSTAFPQQSSALPQQQREGERQWAGDQGLVGLNSGSLP